MTEAHYDRLFIAVPELTFNFNFVNYMYEQGFISPEVHAKILRTRRMGRKVDAYLDNTRGMSLIQRLMATAPELISEDMIDLLAGAGRYQSRIVIQPGKDDTPGKERRRYKKYKPLITPAQANAMRLALRGTKAATRGGLPTDRGQIVSRLRRILGVAASSTTIDLWLNMGLIDAKEAARYKLALKAGTFTKESAVKVLRAKTLLDAMLVLGGITVDDELIALMVRAGLIDERLGKAYQSAVALGIKEWKVFGGARGAEGLRRRMALVLTGSFNKELLDLLYKTRVINGKQWSGLQLVEILARRTNDRLTQDMTRRRYRVRPGEAPVKTFARSSRANDGEILRLLAEGARNASREAEKLARDGRVGSAARSSQYRLAAASLHEAMRSMWDGVGYLTIFGEREVAEAAAESVADMQKRLLTGKWSQLGDSLLWQSKAGVDAYISREENTLRLSRLVHKNIALYQGNVDKTIKLALLQGKSPEELAADVLRYINPDVPGGASYAAMRLARTEINNAFHFSTIRYTRENPWVRGYKWNLSGSHGRPDVCNQMAERDHDGLGAGCYKKANVPGKPHPHCLCYITTIQMSEDEFIAASRAGRFDSFYKAAAAGRATDAPVSSAGMGSYLERGYGNLVENLKNQ